LVRVNPSLLYTKDISATDSSRVLLTEA